MTCGVILGMSPSVMHRRVRGPAIASIAATQRRRLAVGPVLADDDLGRAEVDARADLVRARAEHDDDPLDRRHGLDRAERVLEQRACRRARRAAWRSRRSASPSRPRARRLRSRAAAPSSARACVSTRARCCLYSGVALRSPDRARSRRRRAPRPRRCARRRAAGRAARPPPRSPAAASTPCA